MGGRHAGVGFVMAKASIKKEDNTIVELKSRYDVYMHPQRANNPLQGLERRALTVGTISGPH